MQYSDGRMKGICKAAGARILELEAENKKLKEALKPFAKEDHPREYKNDDDLGLANAMFTFRDLRRAAAALGEKP